jgi:hypothetical protein
MAKTPTTQATPRTTAAGSTPTPTQAENDAFVTAATAGTLPPAPWFHKADGSPVDPQSFDVTVGVPTWP